MKMYRIALILLTFSSGCVLEAHSLDVGGGGLSEDSGVEDASVGIPVDQIAGNGSSTEEVGLECTPATETSECGGNSCDPNTMQCSAFVRDSRLTCESCVSDSDCKDSDHRCVEMRYMSSPFPDANTGFCLEIAKPVSEGATSGYDCAPPYVTVLTDRRSLSGGELGSYCGIEESLTTCPAVNAYREAWPCAGRGDVACPTGGFCEWVRTDTDGWRELCTYACDDASECDGPGQETCGKGYCGW